MKAFWKRTCSTCNKQFEPLTAGHISCSPRCAREALDMAMRKEVEETYKRRSAGIKKGYEKKVKVQTLTNEFTGWTEKELDEIYS